VARTARGRAGPLSGARARGRCGAVAAGAAGARRRRGAAHRAGKAPQARRRQHSVAHAILDGLPPRRSTAARPAPTSTLHRPHPLDTSHRQPSTTRQAPPPLAAVRARSPSAPGLARPSPASLCARIPALSPSAHRIVRWASLMMLICVAQPPSTACAGSRSPRRRASGRPVRRSGSALSPLLRSASRGRVVRGLDERRRFAGTLARRGGRGRAEEGESFSRGGGSRAASSCSRSARACN